MPYETGMNYKNRAATLEAQNQRNNQFEIRMESIDQNPVERGQRPSMKQLSQQRLKNPTHHKGNNSYNQQVTIEN